MGVLRHKNGSYYIRFHHNGRDFEKTIGKDKRAAEIALAEIKNEIKLARLAGQGWEGFEKLKKATKPKLFRESAEENLEERAHYKASSIRAYKAILRSHLLPQFGTKVLKDITESSIRKYQAALIKKWHFSFESEHRNAATSQYSRASLQARRNRSRPVLSG